MRNFSLEFNTDSFLPLAARMRPIALDEYIGQRHLLAEDKPLYLAIQKGLLYSMIFWGPPGTGKTTLAELIAHQAQAEVEKISAVTAGVKEIRESIERAKKAQYRGVRTILFVDEVHRFNKNQQDAFLPYIENGTIIFIGATTENPSFELNSALLSRVKVHTLQALSAEEIQHIIYQALSDSPRGLGLNKVVLPEKVALELALLAQGDARRALNLLEMMVELESSQLTPQRPFSMATLAKVAGGRTARFDKKGDHYYDLISAFHKSVRGSAPDAALYWYARILVAGGDPLFVARRLLAIATEDIGMADPRALEQALSAWDCFIRVGAAEGERAIAQATIYLACAAKSNAVYQAFNRALVSAKETSNYDVPMHLRNAPTTLLKEMGVGEGYRYAHHEANGYAAGENYFPKALPQQQYYVPTDRGLEAKVAEKLNWLRQQDDGSAVKRYVD